MSDDPVNPLESPKAKRRRRMSLVELLKLRDVQLAIFGVGLFLYVIGSSLYAGHGRRALMYAGLMVAMLLGFARLLYRRFNTPDEL